MADQAQDVNQEKLEELQGKVLTDVAGSLGLILAYMGDRLDLYSGLVEVSPATSQELADSQHHNGRCQHDRTDAHKQQDTGAPGDLSGFAEHGFYQY